MSVEFLPGDRVRHVPVHARGDATHPDCKIGRVVRINEYGTVFVALLGADRGLEAGFDPNTLIPM